jgi:hypothetical protein
MRNNGRYSGDDQGRFGGGHLGRGYEEGEDGYRSGYRNQGRNNENRFTSDRWGNGNGHFGGWAAQREIAQFDEDYKYWRQKQMSKLDEDYATWLSERRQKFADEFDKWRSERRKGGIHGGTEKKQ